MHKKRPSYSQVIHAFWKVERRDKEVGFWKSFLAILGGNLFVYVLLCFDMEFMTFYSLSGNIFLFYTGIFSFVCGKIDARYDSGPHSGAVIYSLFTLLIGLFTFITYQLFLFLW